MDEGDSRPSGNDLEASYRLGGSDPTSQIAQAVMVADRPLSGSTWLTVLFWLGSGERGRGMKYRGGLVGRPVRWGSASTCLQRTGVKVGAKAVLRLSHQRGGMARGASQIMLQALDISKGSGVFDFDGPRGIPVCGIEWCRIR
jgi:hypothetical protein